MIAFLKRLLWDETFFERAMRAVLGFAGMLAGQGDIGLPRWTSAVLIAAALFVGAGQKNEPKAGAER